MPSPMNRISTTIRSTKSTMTWPESLSGRVRFGIVPFIYRSPKRSEKIPLAVIVADERGSCQTVSFRESGGGLRGRNTTVVGKRADRCWASLFGQSQQDLVRDCVENGLQLAGRGGENPLPGV